MIIAQITDTHILAPDNTDPQTSLRTNAVLKVVDDINALPERPDIVIHTGDLAQNRLSSEYEFLHAMLSNLEMPFFVVPGNRDDISLVADMFPGARLVHGNGQISETFIHYSIDGFPLRIIALDSQGLTSMKGNFTESRLLALRDTLDLDINKPTALFMHHPPFEVTDAKEPFQYESRDAVRSLAKLLSSYNNIIRVFCGHSHRARMATIGSVPASTMPSTAPDLRQDRYPARLDYAALYQVHKWDGSQGFISSTHIVE